MLDVLPLPEMADIRFRSGSSYTLEELAELARRGLEDRGLTQQQAADYLNEHFTPERGQFHRPQISSALRQPETNPGMVLLLVRAFTDYVVIEPARYTIQRKK